MNWRQGISLYWASHRHHNAGEVTDFTAVSHAYVWYVCIICIKVCEGVPVGSRVAHLLSTMKRVVLLNWRKNKLGHSTHWPQCTTVTWSLCGNFTPASLSVFSLPSYFLRFVGFNVPQTVLRCHVVHSDLPVCSLNWIFILLVSGPSIYSRSSAEILVHEMQAAIAGLPRCRLPYKTHTDPGAILSTAYRFCVSSMQCHSSVSHT